MKRYFENGPNTLVAWMKNLYDKSMVAGELNHLTDY